MTSPRGWARLDRLPLAADAKGFCAVGWFRAGAKGWGVLCYLLQEQELRCHYSSIQAEHPSGNWHGVLNKSNLYVG